MVAFTGAEALEAFFTGAVFFAAFVTGAAFLAGALVIVFFAVAMQSSVIRSKKSSQLARSTLGHPASANQASHWIITQTLGHAECQGL